MGRSRRGPRGTRPAGPQQPAAAISGNDRLRTTKHQIYVLRATQNNQKWTYNTNGTITGSSGKCVAAAGGGTTAGTKLELRTCDGSAAQKWIL
ncbi:MAG TPA: RICIN domain-containing protein [Actinokineospora sp.]|nr:RICIN domain-containing protein [Actinokineospora sp.]